ncbi:hypothetical protein ASE22_09130 [Sphingomonas sp. Root720]|nr:hypothetical protein ASE22_09130 [Sphingomonas sp. Root720]
MAILAAPLAAAAASTTGAMPARLRAMTPDDFHAAVSVSEDAAADRVLLSTQPGFVPQPLSPIRTLLSDNHLRAVIDRTSGAVRYEVHQSIFHWGPRRSFTVARLSGAAGTRAAELILSEDGERFCPNEDGWGHCASTRRIAFEIGEEELRAIAGRYRPGDSRMWTFRIEERGGRHWDGGIGPAEAAGLLLAAAKLRPDG